jgi:isochorismate hydrolase
MGKGIGKGKYRLDRLFFVAEQQILGLHYTAQTTHNQGFKHRTGLKKWWGLVLPKTRKISWFLV